MLKLNRLQINKREASSQFETKRGCEVSVKTIRLNQNAKVP